MKYVWIILIIAVIAVGGYFLMYGDSQVVNPTNDGSPAMDSGDTSDQNGDASNDDDANGDQSTNGSNSDDGVIGSSIDGRDIEARSYGSGDTQLLFVGGIHGGYSPNTTLLSEQLISQLESNPDMIPENVTVTVIPALNPDGLHEVMGSVSGFNAADIPGQNERVAGRFNANGVDLNRNFACNWQADATWRNQSVDAGDGAFSEPESKALRDYVQSNQPDAVVVYYSAAGSVYTSSCNGGSVLSETRDLMNEYANASGYSAEGTFDAYAITGDATDWLAKQGIPAISVLLSTHNSAEWAKNKRGIEAVLDHYEN